MNNSHKINDIKPILIPLSYIDMKRYYITAIVLTILVLALFNFTNPKNEWLVVLYLAQLCLIPLWISIIVAHIMIKVSLLFPEEPLTKKNRKK